MLDSSYACSSGRRRGRTVSAEGDARRKLLGLDTYRAAEAAGMRAPAPTPELLEQLALLLRASILKRPTDAA